MLHRLQALPAKVCTRLQAGFLYLHDTNMVFAWGGSSLFTTDDLDRRVHAGGGADGRGVSEDLIVPKDLDLMALPQLCFPGT